MVEFRAVSNSTKTANYAENNTFLETVGVNQQPKPQQPEPKDKNPSKLTSKTVNAFGPNFPKDSQTIDCAEFGSYILCHSAISFNSTNGKTSPDEDREFNSDEKKRIKKTIKNILRQDVIKLLEASGYLDNITNSEQLHSIFHMIGFYSKKYNNDFKKALAENSGTTKLSYGNIPTVAATYIFQKSKILYETYSAAGHSVVLFDANTWDTSIAGTPTKHAVKPTPKPKPPVKPAPTPTPKTETPPSPAPRKPAYIQTSIKSQNGSNMVDLNTMLNTLKELKRTNPAIVCTKEELLKLPQTTEVIDFLNGRRMTISDTTVINTGRR